MSYATRLEVRRACREITDLLRSDLYKRVEDSPAGGMVWRSPLGWCAEIVRPDQLAANFREDDPGPFTIDVRLFHENTPDKPYWQGEDVHPNDVVHALI